MKMKHSPSKISASTGGAEIDRMAEAVSTPAFIYWLHLLEHTDIKTEGYIGVSRNPQKRLWTHRYHIKRGTINNPHLEAAFYKYGDRIIQTIIDKGTEEYCYKKENKLRPEKDLGWNLLPGGGMMPTWTGKKRPELSVQLKDFWKNNEELKKSVGEKVRKALTGKKQTPERIAAVQKGMAEARKRRATEPRALERK